MKVGILFYSENNDLNGSYGQDKIKSALSLGKQKAAFSPQKLDCNSSFVSSMPSEELLLSYIP
jgi:hypothetical protein